MAKRGVIHGPKIWIDMNIMPEAHSHTFGKKMLQCVGMGKRSWGLKPPPFYSSAQDLAIQFYISFWVPEISECIKNTCVFPGNVQASKSTLELDPAGWIHISKQHNAILQVWNACKVSYLLISWIQPGEFLTEEQWKHILIHWKFNKYSKHIHLWLGQLPTWSLSCHIISA